MIRLVCSLALIAALALPHSISAQPDLQRYHSSTFGVTFAYPSHWTLRENLATRTILAAPKGDWEGLAEGKLPSGVLFSLTFSTFRLMGIPNTDAFPMLLRKYATGRRRALSSVQIGGAAGMSMVERDQAHDLAVYTALLSVGRRRVAILRAVSTLSVWQAGGEATLRRLLATVSFFPPSESADLDRIDIPLWQTAANGLPDLSAIAVSADGALIYVSDAQRGIWQLTADGSPLPDLLTFPQIRHYGQIVTRLDGSMYIADPRSQIVWRRAPNSTSAARFFGGTRGTGRGAFGEGMPRQFVFSGQNVYAVDENVNGVRVQVFNIGGGVIAAWNLAGELPNARNVLLGADMQGNLYLLASGTNGLLKLYADGRVAQRGIGKVWLAESEPLALTLDRFNNFYVATADQGILMLSPDGALIGVIGEPYDESAPPKAGQLARPIAMVTAPSGDVLYVADAGRYPQVVAFVLDRNLSESLARGSAEQGEIGYSEQRRGTLTDQIFLHSYTFNGKAGDTVTITLRSAEFDAYLELLAPDGKLLAANDDINMATEQLSGTDAQIAAFALPHDGRYTVRITRFGRETARGKVGAYTLQLDRIE
ncbi:MAG: pre-peptidase C-terminal domain-containing protein [Anaerolineae bacterium]|nr:pre-peptidase C-terminal domain-containing protein [Anaerolineae bacterium]